jgi:ferredoxin
MAWRKSEDREKSAIRVDARDGGGYDVAACDQCGACAGMCSSMALKRAAGGVVHLDGRLCVGCLICVGECLRNNMHYCDDLPAPFKCTACGLCVKQCPGGALSIMEV